MSDNPIYGFCGSGCKYEVGTTIETKTVDVNGSGDAKVIGIYSTNLGNDYFAELYPLTNAGTKDFVKTYLSNVVLNPQEGVIYIPVPASAPTLYGLTFLLKITPIADGGRKAYLHF